MYTSDETLRSHFYCKLKAYYKSNQSQISNKSFYYFEKYLKKRTNKLFIKDNDIEVNNLNNYQNGHIYSVNNTLCINQYALRYDYIEITKDNFVIPIFVTGNLKIHQEEKNFYAYKSKQLEMLIDKRIYYYKLTLRTKEPKLLNFSYENRLPRTLHRLFNKRK